MRRPGGSSQHEASGLTHSLDIIPLSRGANRFLYIMLFFFLFFPPLFRLLLINMKRKYFVFMPIESMVKFVSV